MALGALAVEPHIAALKDENSDVRQAAAYALGEIKDPRAVEPLIAALKDEDSDVRKAAARALGEIKDPRAVEPLIAALEDEELRVRAAAAEALVKIGAPAVEPLIAALEDEELRVRAAAAEALGQIGDARAVAPLIAALKDTDKYVRKAATEALGKIGAPAVESLSAALKDTDKYVRKAAAYALGEIKDPRAVEPLIAALRDSDVREAAAEALDRLGWKPGKDESAGWYWMAKCEWEKCVALGASAVAPLIAALKDTDKYVRKAAAEALGQIGEVRAIEPLITSLRSTDDPYTRSDVAQALVRLYHKPDVLQESKERILAFRQMITNIHHDKPAEFKDCHSPHTDIDLGVYFPL